MPEIHYSATRRLMCLLTLMGIATAVSPVASAANAAPAVTADASAGERPLGPAPAYEIASVAVAPADVATWEALPALMLAGTNGAAPDLSTRIRLAHCGEHLFVRFDADEPVAPMIIDRLAVFVKGTNPPVFQVNGEGAFPITLPQKLASYTYSNGVWAVVLKCRVAALGIEPGRAKTVEVRFERKRGARGNVPAADYSLTALITVLEVPATRVELTPDDDIQKALDAAAPGDTIILGDGVYYQSLVITRGGMPGRPVTLRAANGGGATLSGAVPPDQAKLNFEPVSGDLYRAAVTSRVWWVMAAGRNLVNYGNLAHLREFVFPNLYGDTLRDGAPEGFAWQGPYLYVRLEGKADPNTVAIEISRPGGHISFDPGFIEEFYCNPDTGFTVPGSGHLFSRTLANIIVRADHVVIEGLRLHLGVGAAVVVHGNEVTIRDCCMTGAHMGVYQPDTLPVAPRGNPPIGGSIITARGLTVEYCEFSCYPSYRWAGMGKWDGLYHGNLAAVFMNYGGPRSIVRHNWIHDVGNDGVQPRGNGTTLPADASKLAYNLIQNCGDDAIEFDSTTTMNLRVHHNVILDSFTLLALSPVMGGGLTIDHNILYVSPEQGLPWCGLFKFGSPWGDGLPTQGARIVHNTMVNTRDLLYFCGGHRYADMVLENNIFYAARTQGWNLPGFVPSRHNLFCGPVIDPKDMPEVMHLDGSPFISLKPMDFALRTDGPAVDSGTAGTNDHHTARGSAPDLGAIELGDIWSFPRPGPRWATGNAITNRPAIPASLHPKWVGME